MRLPHHRAPLAVLMLLVLQILLLLFGGETLPIRAEGAVNLCNGESEHNNCPVEDAPPGGYLIYCPCMGRIGNQAAHLLGAMATAKASGRTLVLPPFIHYEDYGTRFVPFQHHFTVDGVREYVPAVTLEEFLANPLNWPLSERRLYCVSFRSATTCPELRGNPQRTFWDHYKIDFVDSVAVQNVAYIQMVLKLSVETHPVVALAGAPAAFPVESENRHLQRYLIWNETIRERGEAFISKTNMNRPYLALHLRNGIDWERACHRDNGMIGKIQAMASPQCGLSHQRKARAASNITEEICIPGSEEIIRSVLAAQEQFGPFRSIFIGTDHHDHIGPIQEAVGHGVRLIRSTEKEEGFLLDLFVFGQADLMIGNCVSSFTDLAVRDRCANGRPSVFFGFEEWNEENSYIGSSISFD